MELDLATATITPAATASLAPGFRFHPTDEELVRYYLKRKVCGKPFRFDAISEIDIYKTEPWDLPGKSRLKSRDLEWYFFSVLDKKYGNGSKTNRATEKGYWKTTGKDRPIYNKSKTVGMKKTLVFHSGRAPRGQRTNWVMHEYRLVDDDLGKAGFSQDAFVLCRVFQKSGTGPKNGEQYGAPFVEEEWEDDQMVMVPGQLAAEEVAVDDAFLDGDDLQQILEASIPSEDVPLPLDFYYDDNNGSYVPETNFIDEDQKVLVDTATSYCVPEQPDDKNLFNLPVQNDVDVKHEYIGESSNSLNSVGEDYLVEEPFLDASDNILFDDGAFLETNDLSRPVQADPSRFDMLDEYLTFFNADQDNLDYTPFDSSMMTGSENFLPGQEFLDQKQPAIVETQEETGGSQPLLPGDSSDAASTSKKKPGNFGSDIHYPFLEHANRMLGSIPAPPAFASEFPSKEAALRFNSPSPVRVTAGMIQIRNMSVGPNGMSWALGKHLDINIILSFGMPQNNGPVSPGSVSKAGSAITRGFFYLLFGWFVILSMSFKIGTLIYTGKAA